MRLGFAPSSSHSSSRRSSPAASMSSPTPRLAASPMWLGLAFLAVASVAEAQLNCADIIADGQNWDLSKLGKIDVHKIVPETFGRKNLTFSFDLCSPIKMGEGCPRGTRICASEYHYKNGEADDPEPVDQWVVAGEFAMNNGRRMDPTFTRLKTSDSNDDSQKEGLLMTLGGGSKDSGSDTQNQRAIIEFLCAPKKSGMEGPARKAHPTKTVTKTLITTTATDGRATRIVTATTATPTATHGAESRPRSIHPTANDGIDTDKDGDMPDPDEGQSLRLKSYELEQSKKQGEAMVLRVTWRTKFACENATNLPGGDGGNSSGGWGFFTWFILIFFLAIASYLIFGSWLNYNRYGARGWDLLPHGDTIRDIPFLLKDFGRSIASTLQGGRGRDLGYIRV